MAEEGVRFVISAVDDVTKNLHSMQGRFASFASGVGKSIKSAHGHFQTLDRGIGGVTRRIGGLARSLNLLAAPWWIKIAAIGAVTTGVGLFTRAVIGATTQAETLRAQMQTLFGGTWKKTWDWAINFAAKTPFQINEIVEGLARLKAFNIEPFTSLPIIGDLAGAMGRNVNDAVQAVADAIQGRWEMLKMQLGMSRETVEDWARRHRMPSAFSKAGEIVNRPLAIKELMGAMAERGAGGMARMMDTIAGKWSNLKDAAWRFFVQIGDKFSPVVKWLLQGFTTLIGKFSGGDIADKVGNWLKSVFSRDNISKAAKFFATIKVWGGQAFKWLCDVGKQSVNVIVSAFNGLIDVLGGGGGVWEAVKKVAKALLVYEGAKAVFGTIGLVSQLAGLVKMMKNPYAQTVAAGALVGLAGGLIMSIRDYKDEALAKLNDAGLGDEWKKLNAKMKEAPPLPDFNAPLPAAAQGDYDAMMAAFGNGPNWGGKTEAKKLVTVSEVKPLVGRALWDAMKGVAPSSVTKVTVTNLGNPLNKIASNTSEMLGQNRSILDKIYGGGPHATFLSKRLSFGGGAGQSQQVTIRIEGGDAYTQQVAEQAVDGVLRAMNVPHSFVRGS